MKTFTVKARVDVIKTFTILADNLQEAQEIAQEGAYNEEDIIDEEGINYEVLTVE